MKLKFKIQEYQTKAVNAVIDCFKGQARQSGISYHIDPGKEYGDLDIQDSAQAGFKNADLMLNEDDLLENIRRVQRDQTLTESEAFAKFKKLNKKNAFEYNLKYTELAKAISTLNLDVEMETGTGKTYVYIKTIFELNKRFGWSKFIIVVPSIAIREGVKNP